VQGARDALVQLSDTCRTLAVSLYKIVNDIRLISCGPLSAASMTAAAVGACTPRRS
jgi:fumarate hydratase class II